MEENQNAKDALGERISTSLADLMQNYQGMVIRKTEDEVIPNSEYMLAFTQLETPFDKFEGQFQIVELLNNSTDERKNFIQGMFTLDGSETHNFLRMTKFWEGCHSTEQGYNCSAVTPETCLVPVMRYRHEECFYTILDMLVFGFQVRFSYVKN